MERNEERETQQGQWGWSETGRGVKRGEEGRKVEERERRNNFFSRNDLYWLSLNSITTSTGAKIQKSNYQKKNNTIMKAGSGGRAKEELRREGR